MKLNAVVCTYWPNRRQNVEVILESLLDGTRVPDRIFVLDNNPEASVEWQADKRVIFDERIAFVDSTFNTMTRGKYVTALMDVADWYVLIDDDVAPAKRSIEWLEYNQKMTGFWGVTIDDNTRSFMQGVIHGHAIEREVDAFHGRFMFMSFQHIVNMLELEAKVRVGQEWEHTGCDIIAGIANSRWSGRHETYVLRGDQDTWFRELDQCGEALQFQLGYFDSRDDFTRYALEVATQRR